MPRTLNSFTAASAAAIVLLAAALTSSASASIYLPAAIYSADAAVPQSGLTIFAALDDAGTGVNITVTNSSNGAAANDKIGSIYFESSEWATAHLGTIKMASETSGVNFVSGAPVNTPGGNISPTWVGTKGAFSASGNLASNAIGAGSSVTFFMTYVNGTTFNDVVTAMSAPTPAMRMALRIQIPNAYGSLGSSAWEKVVPAPGAVALLGMAFLFARRHRRPSDTPNHAT